MLVKDLMHKGLHLIDSELSVKQASRIMGKLDIGALIVGRPDKLEGIFSERDLMCKVVSLGLPVDKTTVKDVMTKKVLTIQETEDADIALNQMNSKKIRHLPVVNENNVCVGMIGIRDLMGAMLDKLEAESTLMVEYLMAVSRVAIAITELGDEKGFIENDQIVINHKMTKSEFENLCDTTKKILDMVLDKLEGEGIISISKNKIVIIDKDKLSDKIL